MSGVNKVLIIGKLGKDPELRFTPGGQAVCDLSIATSERWQGKDGEKKESTEWHKVVVWGKTAENCAAHLAKGRECFVEGSLKTRKWQDKDGKDRWTTEIQARDVQFLGGKPDPHKPGADHGSHHDASDGYRSPGEDIEDDINF